MPGVRLELANLDEYFSPKDYVERHLAPVATELHRLTNELMAPGSTAEDAMVDMCPALPSAIWMRLDKHLDTSGKRVIFDGSEYFSVPKELLKVKQAKVQLVAMVYAKSLDRCQDAVHFRLVRDDGMVIKDSHISVACAEPFTAVRVLPFGDAPGLIVPAKRTYYLEGCSPERSSLPVCRRFSLSFVYI